MPTHVFREWVDPNTVCVTFCILGQAGSRITCHALRECRGYCFWHMHPLSGRDIPNWIRSSRTMTLLAIFPSVLPLTKLWPPPSPRSRTMTLFAIFRFPSVLPLTQHWPRPHLGPPSLFLLFAFEHRCFLCCVDLYLPSSAVFVPYDT